MNKLKELKIIFETQEDTEFISQLIADCFYKNDITGVEIGSPEEKTDDWGDDAIFHENYFVSSYINYEEIEKIDIIKKDVLDLLKNFSVKIEFYEKDINEEDWANSWKDFFYPVEVSDKVVIKPTWREVDKDYEVVIEIDPGMAFGSGSHPTTNLCIKSLEDVIKGGETVLDIGCGSGILMIGALKLGASYATGLDNDIAAVGISKNNLLLNNIDENKFRVLKSDLVDQESDTYNIVVANILAEVICELIPNLNKVSNSETKFIFSGIIAEKKEMVLKKMEEFNMVSELIYEDSGWVCIQGIFK